MCVSKMAESRRLEQLRAQSRAHAAHSSGSASASSSGVSNVVPRSDDGHTSKDAAAWIPPKARIYKDVVVNHRWRIVAPWLPGGSKYKSWGEVTHLSDYEAMKFVIEFAWAEKKKLDGLPCPWVFPSGELDEF